MKDVHNPLLKAYTDALSGIGCRVFEGEEPDDLEDKMYAVISDVTSTDTSTYSSSDVRAQIQITVNSWEFKYNNSKALNEICGTILETLKPTPAAVLDLSAFGMQMGGLTVQNDRVQNYGKLAGRVFISRQIIFDQLIFIN